MKPNHSAGALLAVFFLAFLLTSVVMAQPKPIRWNRFSDEDLAMTSFPDNPDASSVTLCDFGEMHIEPMDDEVTLRRHVRIKLLSEAGYEKGNVVLMYRDGDDIDDLKAQTVYLDENGRKQSESIGRREFVREDLVSGLKTVSFTLKGLRPGAIIEYQYTHRTDDLMVLPTWYFQSDAPTLWSELHVRYPQFIAYTFYFGGTSIPMEHDEILESVSGSNGYDDNVLRWAKKDIPALTSEPFMTALDDHYSRVEGQLSSIAQPGFSPLMIMSNWNDFTQSLVSRADFGQQIGKHRQINEKALSLTEGRASPREKMKAVYDYVSNHLSWSGRFWGSPDREIDTAFESGNADLVEINLILASMFRAVGLESHPVLGRTRDKGKVIREYPILSQFNYMLTYVKIGRNEHLVDATDRGRPIELLPVRALNGRAWLLDGDSPRWIVISHDQAYGQETTADLVLDETGSLAGSVEIQQDGYGGLLNREKLKNMDPTEFIKESFLSDLNEASFDSSAVINIEDSQKPLVSRFLLALPEYGQSAGGFLYLNPAVLGQWKSNPLKSPNRTFPVDFGYPFVEGITMKIQLPLGWVVEEVPPTESFRMSNGACVFRRHIQVDEGIITYTSNLNINRDQFSVSQYAELRAFLDEVVESFNEQVVLKRVPGESNGQ